MYQRVKSEILNRSIAHTIIDFSKGLDSLTDPFAFRRDSTLLLLEHTSSIPENKNEQLNYYIKRLTDHAAGPLLWYLSVESLGRLSSGYGSRVIGAFQTITRIE